MGVVKNRCKNGDFYWVSAYVTPIMEDGRLTGYESVRVNPTRKQIERAELLYARLLIGKPAIPLLRKFMVVLCRYVVSIIAGMVACGATLLLPSLAALSVTFILFLASGWWICARQEKVLKAIFKTVPHAFKDSLSSLTYSDRPGSLGELELILLSEDARLKTALTRLDDLAGKVAEAASHASLLSTQIEHALVAVSYTHL